MTLTPSQLVGVLALTTLPQDIVKPADAHTSIIRTLIVQGNTAARTVTLDMATSTDDAAATRIVDGYPLTINIPWITNFWLVCTTTTWLVGLASDAGSTVMISASGYDAV